MMTADRQSTKASANLQTDDLDRDLPRRSVRSGAAVLIGRGATVVLGFVATAVLARILTPQDFGLIGMAAAFIALITNLAELGLPLATVQRAHVTEAQVNALFWLNAALGVAVALIGAALSYPISWFYGEPELGAIMIALSLAFIPMGLSAQHRALLRRRMRFAAISIIEVSALAAAIACSISMALLGAGYWALVVLSVGALAYQAIGFWIACDWRPGRPARAAGLGSMLRFGAFLSGTQVLGTVARNVDRILIGRFFGAAAAGYYMNAHRLLLMPVAQLNLPLSTVAIPTLSRLQNEPERYRLFYRRGVEAIAAVSLPAVLACLISADHLVPAVLGEQWKESIPIFKALGPAALLATINVATSWVYIPLGRTDRQFRWHVFRSICVVIAYFIGIRWGALGIAAAFSTTACVLRVPAILYCFRGTFLSGADVVDATWRVFAASALASAVAVPAALRLGPDAPHIFALAVIFGSFGISYAVAWMIVPGGRRRLAAMLVTARHLMPGSSNGQGTSPASSEIAEDV